MSEFTCVNAIAYDIIRVKALQENKVPPCWLCLSDEAKEEGRELAAKWYNENADPVVPVSVKDPTSLSYFENIAEKAIGPQMRAWQSMEEAKERAREAGDPTAYFMPHLG